MTETKLTKSLSVKNEVHDSVIIIELPDILTQNDFKKWLESYEQQSGQQFRVRTSNNNDTMYVTYRARLSCHHNTQPVKTGTRKPARKHTDCPVEMKVLIRDSSAPDLIGSACKVEIHGQHNHPLNVVDVLKFNRVSNSTKRRFLEFFEAGYTPVQALEAHKQDMLERYGDDYSQHIADRSLCPDMSWVYSLFNKEFKKHRDQSSVDEILASIMPQVEKFESEGHKIGMGTVESDFFVVLITKFAERVHLLESSGQVVFYDTLNIIKEKKSDSWCVYLMMANSDVGGVPLGFFILSSETEALLTAALVVYLQFIANDSFGGRGTLGPQVFLIHNCKATRNAFRVAFPNSVLLTGMSYVLESTWKWLWNSHHKIDKEDRMELFKSVSSLVHCKSASELECLFELCLSDEKAQKRQTYVAYLKNLRKNSRNWALGYHKSLVALGINTSTLMNNLQVLKDKVFFHTRAFSLEYLLNFVVNNLSNHYQRKVASLATGRYEEFLQTIYGGLTPTDLQVAKSDEVELYNVASFCESTSFDVAYFLGRCECSVGSFGGPCKHQHAVALHEGRNTDGLFDNERKSLCLQTLSVSESYSEDLFQNLTYASGEVMLKDGLLDSDIITSSILDNSVALEMEVSTENESYNDNAANSTSKLNHARLLLDDMTSTVLKCLETADESLYHSFVQFHAAFKAASTDTSSVQEFFQIHEALGANSKTIIILPPVPVPNLSVSAGKLPIPVAHVTGTKRTQAATDHRNKRLLLDEHGYAARNTK